jgi:hypothetical protein
MIESALVVSFILLICGVFLQIDRVILKRWERKRIRDRVRDGTSAV